MFPNGTMVVDKVQSGADGDGGAYRCTAADKLMRSASGTVHVKVMGEASYCNCFTCRLL